MMFEPMCTKISHDLQMIGLYALIQTHIYAGMHTHGHQVLLGGLWSKLPRQVKVGSAAVTYSTYL